MKSKIGKALSVVPALLFALALIGVACGGSALTVGVIYDAAGRGDRSFNDLAFVGLDRAEADLGVDYIESTLNSESTNHEQLVAEQATTQGLVIGVGFQLSDALVAAAQMNPDVMFGVVDGEPTGVSPANMAHLVFAEHEGSFLVGVAAGLKTNSDQIGLIGGVASPLLHRFEAGFRAGVATVNPDAIVTSEYITALPDFTGFNSPGRARDIANRMYGSGTDIIYHTAGTSGIGVFWAAKSHSERTGNKVWVIGVDADQYNTVEVEHREYTLTSMLKRVDVAVFNAIQDAQNGTFAGGNEPIVYDLERDGVGYATSGGFIDDIVPQLEDFKARIIAGDIVVPSTLAELSSNQ